MYFQKKQSSLVLNSRRREAKWHPVKAREAKGQAEGKQMIGSMGNKARAEKDKTSERAQAAKEKTKSAAQGGKEKTSVAAHKAGEKAHEGTEKTSGILQQTVEEGMHTAQKTADAVKRTFGMAKNDEEEDVYKTRD